jgi:Signal transduction histidine kinase
MQSNEHTSTLSEGISLPTQREEEFLSEGRANIEDVRYRFRLISKPLWFRLVVSLIFVAAALSATSLLWMVVDRPISAPLFLVAIVASAWLCGFRAALFATVVSGFVIDYFFIPPVYELSASRDEIVRFLIFFAEGTIISWVIETRRIATEAMNQSNELLRALAERQQTVRESEQKRIALEIHDELGQALTGLKMEVHLLKRQSGSTPAENMAEKLGGLSSTIDATIATVRRIATELRPSILDDFGLVAAMEWQGREFERKTDICCVFRADVEHLNLDPQAKIAVFRIFQEAVTNISRHSEASVFTVEIDSGSDPITLTIKDDGKGLDPGVLTNTHSLGILGMKERSRLIGSEFKIYNDDGGGVAIELKIPKSLQLRTGK